MNLPGLTLLVLGVGGLQIMLDKGAIWIGSTQYNNNINSSISYFYLFSHLGVDLRETRFLISVCLSPVTSPLVL